MASSFQLLDVLEKGRNDQIEAFDVHLLLCFIKLELLDGVDLAIAHQLGVVAYSKDEKSDVSARDVVLDVLDSGQLLEILERYELKLEIVCAVVSSTDQRNQMHQEAEIMLLELLDVLQQVGLDRLFQSPAYWKPRQND